MISFLRKIIILIPRRPIILPVGILLIAASSFWLYKALFWLLTDKGPEPWTLLLGVGISGLWVFFTHLIRAPIESPDKEKPIGPGFLNDAVAVQRGFETISQVLTKVTTEWESIAREVEQYTTTINTYNNNPSVSLAEDLQYQLRELSKDITTCAATVSDANSQYRSVFKHFGYHLENLIKSHNLTTDRSQQQLREFLNMLQVVEQAASRSKHSLMNATVTLRRLPHAEQQTTQAARKLANEIQNFIDHINTTGQILRRARASGESLLQFAGKRS